MFAHLHKQYHKQFVAKYNFGKKITNALLTQLPLEKQGVKPYRLLLLQHEQEVPSSFFFLRYWIIRGQVLTYSGSYSKSMYLELLIFPHHTEVFLTEESSQHAVILSYSKKCLLIFFPLDNSNLNLWHTEDTKICYACSTSDKCIKT